MKKRGAIFEGMIVVTVAVAVLLVVAVCGTNSIDKNIEYYGDSITKKAYATDECGDTIKQIDREDRVAFRDMTDISNRGYIIEKC